MLILTGREKVIAAVVGRGIIVIRSFITWKQLAFRKCKVSVYRSDIDIGHAYEDITLL